MKRLGYIFIAVVAFSSCGTTSYAPLDDAYIWPDNTTSAATPETGSSVSTDSESVAAESPAPVSAGPTLEFTNVQDTTITVKIKR